ncbi:NAD(P)-dependent oxidoreductase [Amycolatopsis sp. DSM 110486]|uniref:NAD-dependent epimerase/dehydratase family protein n=1 Tax=Amycolatopsis sp. DSM 110486 TaxID=2865832 RepID=UPI001C6A7274|nr:NAD-dependent epimerase/dehydratase family protein [Amycolatopsis sp. DSM 110486]QYN22231.1 NAD-dependent epimerase/dehydratase family protein [Amycolatopsis sp. DSM 110486]
MTADLGAVSTTDILVTGATGFIGCAVVRELVASGCGPRVRVLVRRPLPDGTAAWPADAGVRPVAGDLADPASLAGVCAGVTTLVHLAAQVGGDEQLCTTVNEDGTRALLAEAARAGTTRVLHLSTCAVYRDGDHRGASESVLVTGPASATSRSRLAAERLVRAAGGAVLRPHLVYGVGDRHVVPALVRWLRAVPAWAAGGDARTSVVSVTDLAAVVVALIHRPGLPGEVFHVADPRPVRMRRLVTAVCDLLGEPLPAADLPLGEHRERTREALPWLSDHQYSLLTRDHWYESSRVWARTGVPTGPGLVARLAEAAQYYRETLFDRVGGI